MNDIDAISKALGELKAESAEAQRQRDAIFRKLDIMSDKGTEESVLLRRHMDEFQRHSEDERARWDEVVHPAISDYKRTKNRAIGVLATIALMGAASWEIIRMAGRKLGFF